jgi:hypothetical protein
VAVHGDDLDHELGFDDLPSDLIEALVHAVVGLRLERGEPDAGGVAHGTGRRRP